MRHIPEETLEDLRTALEAEKAAVEEELAERGKATGSGTWDASSKLEGEEADPADAADQIEELVTNVPLVKELEERLRDINLALKKMSEGTYGRCEVSGEEIPLDRLDANPAARTCIKHAK
ncbi:TraR/DksA C4-type zinc finger protein [Candidatus Kaiserbacteria bacterium]|nr:TraR/DksA C4-type zinc finger protein [Candidatus Kaiserbacteria bacterium]